MQPLKLNPKIKAFQEYIQQMEIERGFILEDVKDKCILLGEEIGELFKSIRKSTGMKTEVDTKISAVSDEIADVFIYLLSISNSLKIDLEKAFRDKEEKNNKRVWA